VRTKLFPRLDIAEELAKTSTIADTTAGSVAAVVTGDALAILPVAKC